MCGHSIQLVPASAESSLLSSNHAGRHCLTSSNALNLHWVIASAGLNFSSPCGVTQ